MTPQEIEARIKAFGSVEESERVERSLRISGMTQEEELLAYAKTHSGPPPLRSEVAREASLRNREAIMETRRKAMGEIVGATVTPQEYRASVVQTDAYAKAYVNLLKGQGHFGAEDRAVMRSGEVRDRRDLSGLVGAAGAYTVPAAFLQELTKSQLNGSPLRALVRTLDDDNGRTRPWPLTDDTAVAAGIVAENVAISHATDPSLTQATLGAFTWVAPAVLIPFALIADGGLDILGAIGGIAGDRIARGTSAAMITGSGTGTYLGLAAGVTVGKTTASNAAITYAEWGDFAFSLRAAYRNGPLPAIVMHSSTYQTALGLEDDSHRPLFDSNSQRMFGFNVVLDDDVAQISASAVVAYAGRFDLGAIYRNIQPVVSIVLHERYADSLTAAVIVAARSDFTMNDGAALRSFKMHS